MRLRKSRIPRWFGHTAISLPPWVTLVDGKRLATMTPERQYRLMRHERYHWYQYEKLGFWRCYLGYIYWWFRYQGWTRAGYLLNPREIEARDYASDYGFG